MSQFLHELLLDAPELVDDLDHVHGNADGPRLVGDAARDRLPNPPGSIRRKLVAAPIFEFLDPFHQSHVAFLDQIEERLAAVGVFLGNRNYQTQVGFDHVRLGLMRFDHHPA